MTGWEVVVGDALDVLAAMDPESVDSIVCDPPYGLEFMGKEWDRLGAKATHRVDRADEMREENKRRYIASGVTYGHDSRAMQAWHEAWAVEALRVLKPGGHLLAFGGTRTYHRMASGVEDAGFEVRDQLQWLYGSGFPKSLDVGKAIDAQAGAVREVVGQRDTFVGADDPIAMQGKPGVRIVDVTAPATPDAERWQGWGTALKPAHEPIVVARKPLSGTVAANVLAHGSGALNVDGCRIGTDDTLSFGSRAIGDGVKYGEQRPENQTPGEQNAAGRWPANVVLDPEAAAMLDEQTGELGPGAFPARRGPDGERQAYGAFNGQDGLEARRTDSGGASRFFYCAKASSAERNALELARLPRARSRRKRRHQDLAGSWRERARNRHPTVKPVELMRWLVRLVTPPGGLVLDPFTGSGTTGCAAMLERARFVGIERDRGSAVIAEARIAWWAEHPDGVELVRRLEREVERAAVAAAGQEVLF